MSVVSCEALPCAHTLHRVLPLMGSCGIFSPRWCYQCVDGERLPTYPVGRSWCCECVKRSLFAQRRLQLDPVARVCAPRLNGFSLTLQHLLVDLDVFVLDLAGNVSIPSRTCRLHFLMMVLMSRGSFCRDLFTYSSNGVRGNISDTEDIADRIMSFV